MTGFLLACSLALVQGQDQPVKPDPLLKEIKEETTSWNIGFCALGSDSELPAAILSLTRSLPTLWRDAFTGELNHSIGEAEQAKTALALLEQARNTARTAISQLIEDRDKAWLASTLTPVLDLDFDTKIVAAREKLAKLLRIDPAMVTVAPKRKLVVAALDKDRLLFAPINPGKLATVDRLAQEKKLQMVVYGDISQDKDYIFLRLYVWDSQLRQVTWQESRALRADEASSRVEDQIEGMAGALLGYLAAGVKVTAVPEGTLILLRPVSGSGPLYRDIGSANFRFLEPGDYNLYLQADGYQPLQQKISLDPGKVAIREATLAKADVKFLAIDSSPSGAAVYLYSRYQGKTPLELPLPEDRTTIFLEMPGYQKLQLTIGPDTSSPQQVLLMKDILNWSAEVKIRRDRFYESLGWFALSCLPPIMFNGLYQNIVTSVTANGGSDEIRNLGNLYYRLYLGSFILTGVALIDTGLKLSEYLEAADYLSGRN